MINYIAVNHKAIIRSNIEGHILGNVGEMITITNILSDSSFEAVNSKNVNGIITLNDIEFFTLSENKILGKKIITEITENDIFLIEKRYPESDIFKSDPVIQLINDEKIYLSQALRNNLKLNINPDKDTFISFASNNLDKISYIYKPLDDTSHLTLKVDAYGCITAPTIHRELKQDLSFQNVIYVDPTPIIDKNIESLIFYEIKSNLLDRDLVDKYNILEPNFK